MVTPSLRLCTEISDRRRVHGRLQLRPFRRGAFRVGLFDEGLEPSRHVGDFLAELVAWFAVLLSLIELGLELFGDRDRPVQERQHALLVDFPILGLGDLLQLRELGLLAFRRLPDHG
jgi:hypothetical protein